MIAFLRGTLLEKRPNQVIVETQGVGYDVTIPVSTFSALPQQGAAVSLRIHTHVREDSLALFGFVSVEEKSLFEKLISVSGIGPKLAITILSGLATPDLIQAIRGRHVEMLVRIPGVGKKTAERIVLELSEKLDAIASGVPAASIPATLNVVESDVASALVNLGLAAAAAEQAIRKAKAAGAASDFESLFRKSMEFVR
jgi:Holliday junction DNA helicase RuvA